MKTEENTFNILYVEDNPGDVRLVMEVLKEGNVRHNLILARNGEEAIAILRRSGSYKNVKSPDIILLDLNLPKKSGLEVLAEVRATENLKRIPVIVLSSSKSENDVLKCYDLYANSYITKPIELDQFMDTINSIVNFWMKIAILPPR